MKSIITITLLVFAAGCICSGKDYARKILSDNSAFYKQRVDDVVQKFLTKGIYPTEDDIVRIQTLENHFHTAIRLNTKLINRTPPLLLTKVKIKDYRNFPGQFIVARAHHAGLDLRADKLGNRAFRKIPTTH